MSAMGQNIYLALRIIFSEQRCPIGHFRQKLTDARFQPSGNWRPVGYRVFAAGLVIPLAIREIIWLCIDPPLRWRQRVRLDRPPRSRNILVNRSCIIFEHVDNLGATPHPVRRSAFSSHLISTAIYQEEVEIPISLCMNAGQDGAPQVPRCIISLRGSLSQTSHRPGFKDATRP